MRDDAGIDASTHHTMDMWNDFIHRFGFFGILQPSYVNDGLIGIDKTCRPHLFISIWCSVIIGMISDLPEPRHFPIGQSFVFMPQLCHELAYKPCTKAAPNIRSILRLWRVETRLTVAKNEEHR